MDSELCRRFGIDFPLFAFSHCRDVVAAVSREGGLGVFGAVTLPPDELERELAWIDAQVGGKPYGVDLIVPGRISAAAERADHDEVLAAVPDEHRRFVAGVLADAGIAADDLDARARHYLGIVDNVQASGADAALDVVFSHRVALVANALGVPPPAMLERGRANGVAVAALVGSREHAEAQVAAGVDLLVAAGGEAGGHCGDVATLVLVPDVVSVAGGVPVLAAGGIVTGEQMAACMAMGAAGAWTGSVWLTTAEAETTPTLRAKMLAAGTRDTVRSRSRTGKPSRQLVSGWTEAWQAPGSPRPLPMPLQSLLAEPALAKIEQLAEAGHEGARELATYWVGQGVGLMNTPQSVRGVMQEFREGFVAAYERLEGLVAG